MKYRANASEPWKELYIKALDSMPIGIEVGYYGSINNIPTGWLLCDGSTLDAETYPELYDVLGGTGSTFTLPNKCGRVGVGYDANDTDFNAIGKTGGSKYLQEHTHRTARNLNQNSVGLSGSQVTGAVDYGSGTQLYTEGVYNLTTGNSGNLQPYIVEGYIIKAKNTTPTMASIVNTTNNSTTDGYSCDFINKLQPVVLYDNTTGTNGSITLNDDATNYSYLMVYWKSTWNSTRQGVAIAPTFANNWSLFEEVVESGSGSSVYKNIAIYAISETNFGYVKASNYNNQNANTFYITKIVGYK